MSTVMESLEQKLPKDVVKYCILPYMGITEAQVRKRHKWCMNELLMHQKDIQRRLWRYKAVWQREPGSGGTITKMMRERHKDNNPIITEIFNRTQMGSSDLHIRHWRRSKLMTEIIGKQRSRKIVAKRMYLLHRFMSETLKRQGIEASISSIV